MSLASYDRLFPAQDFMPRKGFGNLIALPLQGQCRKQALTTVFGAARGIDEKTLMIQYLDTLKTLGTSAATKFILPMEFTELIRPFRNVISTAEGGSARDGDK